MINAKVIRFPKSAVKEAVFQFRTPFFLYDEKKIRDNCRLFKNSFKKYFSDFSPLYAVKANNNPHILKIITDEGFGLDCSSYAEAWLAKKMNVHGMYTGNYTTEEEFKFVLNYPKLLLNLDDLSMIKTVERLGLPKIISFRINPGISQGGMKSLFTAGPDAKFGVPWEKSIFAYKLAEEAGVKRFGIHMMTGSNILDEEYFIKITDALIKIAGKIKSELNIDFDFLNIGGGFGVPYKPSEKTLNLDKIARGIRKVFDKRCKEYNLKEPKLMAEPGRMIMADAGFLIAKVQVIKNGYKKFAGVDAGMNDLPRPAIYDAYHHITILNKKNDGKLEPINIVGRICENNDQFARNRLLPSVKVGDFLIIHNAGAHSFAMGHNYNTLPRGAEYLYLPSKKFKQIRRKEETSDLFRTIMNSPFKIN